MQEQEKKTFAKAVELTIGCYAQLPNVPAMGRYDWQQPIMAIVETASRKQGVRVLQQVLLQLVLHLPANAAQISLHEPTPSKEFAEIKHLFAATQGMLGEQWFSGRDVVRGLHDWHEKLMQRASLLAAARQETIYSYNTRRRTPEAIQFLLLTDVSYLVKQDTAILNLLTSFVQQGPRCGLIPIFLHDLDSVRNISLPPIQLEALYTTLGQIAPEAFCFDFVEAFVPYGLGTEYEKFVYDFGYCPDFQVPEDFVSNAILAAREAAVEKSPEQDFLRIRIGEAQAQPAYFALGAASNVFNALLSGGSGSGKTTLLQHLLLSCCEMYSPDELQLILLDYGTVSFNPYRDVAHTQYLFDEPQNGNLLARLFDFLVRELHRRKDMFKQCGREHNAVVDNRQTYSKYSGVTLPIWLIVIDEFGSLMGNENQTMAIVSGQTMRIRSYADRVINLLVREGRKVGLHLVLVTQSFAKVDYMPQDVKSNPHLAIGLKAETPHDSRALLSSDNEVAFDLKRFQAVLNAASGKRDGNVIIDLDHISEASILQRQQALQKNFQKTVLSELEMFLEMQNVQDISQGETPKKSARDSDDVPDWLSS